MDKPDVDFIEGLSPAISIDQKSASPQPALDRRHHHRGLRLPPPAVRPHRRAALPRATARVITRQTPQQIVDRMLELPEGTRFQVLAPVVRGRKGEYETLLADLAAQGFVRARIDGEVARAHRVPKGDDAGPLRAAHDRGRRRPAREARRASSAGSPTRWRPRCGWPRAWPRSSWCPTRGRGRRARDRSPSASTWPARTAASRYEELAPRNFSFNSPYGACEHCDGLGTRFEVDPELVVPEPRPVARARAPSRPWAGGHTPVLHPAARGGGRGARHRPSTRRGRKLTDEAAEGAAVRHGDGPGARSSYKNRYGRARQLLRHLRGRRSRGSSAATPTPRATGAASRSRATCARCRARRAAAPGSSRSRWPSRSTAATSRGLRPCRSARPPRRWPSSSCPSATASSPSGWSRRSTPAWGSCSTSGLDYLIAVTARRPRWPAARRSASGWPARSARGLVGVLYVLDEPSIGLHQRDNHRLIDTLDPPARPRQHGARRRARRGHHHASPTTSSTSGPAPASTAATSCTRAGRRACSRTGVDHRPVPVGQADRSRCPSMRRTPGGDWLIGAGRPRAQPAEHRRRASRSAASSPSPACRARASRRWSTTSSTGR